MALKKLGATTKVDVIQHHPLSGYVVELPKQEFIGGYEPLSVSYSFTAFIQAVVALIVLVFFARV